MRSVTSCSTGCRLIGLLAMWRVGGAATAGSRAPVDVQRRARGKEGDAGRVLERIVAVEHAVEQLALALAANQQQAGVGRCEAGRGQADAAQELAGARAAGGVGGDVGAARLQCRLEVLHAREEGGRVAV